MWNSGSPISSMTILNDKVGIGTENPLAALHLKGSSDTRLQLENSDAASNSNKVNFKDALGENYLEVKGGSSGYFSFKTDANGDASAQMVILNNGSVGIGTESPGSTYKLSVNGKIRTKEIRVETGWSDFVFNKDYKLKSLEEVEKYIKENKHLPDIPSEKEVMENGIELGDMNSKLVQKIEELTLYLIRQNKEINELKKSNEELRNLINNK